MATKTLSQEAHSALSEALVMSESIQAVLESLVDMSDSKTFPLLEAIRACAQRAHDAVWPVIERNIANGR